MNMSKVVAVDEKFCFPEETHLTVRKTSVFFPGDGFIVYDPNGDVLFRFDSYGPDSKPKDELVLMDASGKCLLTLLNYFESKIRDLPIENLDKDTLSK